VDGEDVTTAESWLANLRGDVFVSTRVFAYGLTRQSGNKFQGINLRSVYQAGGGYQFIENERTDLRASLGGGLRYEKYTAGGDETVSIASVNGSFRQQLGPFVYELAADASPSLEDFENYQVLALTSLTATIIKGFGFRIGFTYNFNNQPPEGRKKYDTELSTTLSYSIGK
jgi:putative salt-induced outer membrane protein